MILRSDKWARLGSYRVDGEPRRGVFHAIARKPDTRSTGRSVSERRAPMPFDRVRKG